MDILNQALMMVLTYFYHIFSRGVVSKPPPLLPNVFINNLSIVNPYLKPYCTGGGGGLSLWIIHHVMVEMSTHNGSDT